MSSSQPPTNAPASPAATAPAGANPSQPNTASSITSATSAPAAAPTRKSSSGVSEVPCLQALGPAPRVSSLDALRSFASVSHCLTNPLPTPQSQLLVTAMCDSLHAQSQRAPEFHAQLDAHTRASADACAVLPAILQKQQSLQSLFQRISAFDAYTQQLDRYVTYVEGRVQQVDQSLKRTQAEQAKDASGAQKNAIRADVENLWATLKSFGKSSNPHYSSSAASSNPPAAAASTSTSDPSSTSSASHPASSSGSAISNTVTVLDIVDVWTPFETAPDIREYFDTTSVKTATTSASGSASTTPEKAKAIEAM